MEWKTRGTGMRNSEVPGHTTSSALFKMGSRTYVIWYPIWNRTYIQWRTPYATSFKRRFSAYHHAVKLPHTNIILSWFIIPLVLKCAAKTLNISLQIKNYVQKCFWMEKLLSREVTIFSEKNKTKKKRFNVLLKIHKTQHQIVRKAYQWSKRLKKSTNSPESKVKDFWIISLAYAKSLFKNILDIKFLIVNRFSKFLQHILGLKECSIMIR